MKMKIGNDIEMIVFQYFCELVKKEKLKKLNS